MSDNTNPFAEADADPFMHDDAAYVLGALSPHEREAFEAHLRDCDACFGRVQELSGMTSLLQDVTEADLLAIDERPPDTLLPRLMRQASARRRRSRTLIGALAAVAAACAISLVVVLWPSSSTPAPAGRPFHPVIAAPIAANAVLTSTAWGTSIELNCRYTHSGVDHAWTYDLVVYDRAGNKHVAGDWTVPPDKDISYTTGTSLDKSQISKLVITLPDGTQVMRLIT
jgi:hypothetical protein